jgi:hypothetical protein
MLLFLAFPAWTAYANCPHYATYTNALGGGRVGYFFPHDEFYDDGLREAIGLVCARAPQGSAIAGETPGVFRYYLQKFGRADLASRVLSARDFDPAQISGPTFIIVQRGRVYFENQEKIKLVRERFEKVYEVPVEGAIAAEVYAAR